MEDHAAVLTATAHRERLLGALEREALAAPGVVPVDVGAVAGVAHRIHVVACGHRACIG
jgi:hypothetical protein